MVRTEHPFKKRRSWVVKNAIPHAQLTFQILTLHKKNYTTRARINNMEEQMFGPDNSIS